MNSHLTNYEKDLTELIKGWMENVDQVIVMIDDNVDLSCNKKAQSDIL